MSRRAAGIVIALALVIVVASLWAWRRSERRRTAPAEPPAAAPAEVTEIAEVSEPAALPGEPPWQAELYYPASSRRLEAEQRELPPARAPKARVRAVVEALLAGPQKAGLEAPFPAGVTLGGVFLSGDGTAFVDLRSPDASEPPASGSELERLRVMSFVATVTANVPEVQQVALLWNGSQRLSFAGHLDTSRPLALDRSLLAAP